MGQDALERRRVVGSGLEGGVDFGVGGEGRVRGVGDEGCFLLALLVGLRHRVLAVGVLAGLLCGHGESEHGVVLTDQSLNRGEKVLLFVRGCG